MRLCFFKMYLTNFMSNVLELMAQISIYYANFANALASHVVMLSILVKRAPFCSNISLFEHFLQLK